MFHPHYYGPDYVAGYVARLAGKSKDTNPMLDGWHYDSWDAGWDWADRDYGSKLADYHKGQFCTRIGRTCQEGWCNRCSQGKKEKNGKDPEH